ncbi:MAG: tRNA (adenosine(37)-N6)-threonylcarbamoyltransferase complex transferase subunit TsaD [Patescibacteria group bacterium]
MIILGIETSCDETSVAFLQAKQKQDKVEFEVLSNTISSQVEFHAKFGGVVPSLAARKHSENIDKVFQLAFKQAGIKKKPDLIAVTKGPGLAPALLVGVNFAKALAYFLNKPLVGVNHLEGHILSNWLKPIGKNSQFSIPNSQSFPAVVLLISGGHTELVLMKGFGKYCLLGQTLDDAAGECFDKVARLLGLGYPGGPAIDKLAKLGNPRAFNFPSPLIHSKNYNFSFSGLKTAMLYFLKDNRFDFSNRKINRKTKKIQQDITASFQEAVTKVLIKKTLKAAEEFKAKQIFVCGGVAANTYLKASFLEKSEKVPVKFPEKDYITDNAAMIAAAGFFHPQPAKNPLELEVEANLRLG